MKPKGWKDFVDKKEKFVVKDFACENGKDAVPHSVLISKLQNCSSISEQIETFNSVMRLTSNDIEKRINFCRHLEDVLRIYFPKLKICPFGSTVTELGLKGCDLDMCLQTNFEDEEYVTLQEVPNLSDVKEGLLTTETLARMTPLYMTRFIKKVFQEHCHDIKEIIQINGRCPILKFYSDQYDLFCDFSCENKVSMKNTKLILFLGKLDERYLTITRIIRYWAKCCDIVGGFDKFSCYALSLLVLHFLQTRNPPILPPINEVSLKSEYVNLAEFENFKLLFEDIKKFPKSKNFKTVEELLREFFFYFLMYDFDSVMQLSTGSSIPLSSFVNLKYFDRKMFNTVNIQDPFIMSYNVTVGAQFASCEKFQRSLIQACEAFQKYTFLIPNTEKFGLCSLFLKPTRHTEIQNCPNTIEICSIPDASSKLKKVLEYGLLFNCVSFDMNSEQSSVPKILKLHCKAYYNTWKGRYWINKQLQNSDNCSPLEVEHLISKEITSKFEPTNEVLCEFDCECKESINNTESKLMVHLNFKEEKKGNKLLTIFLKEFIPPILSVL
ncbi:speckle targeted PIP5K1A-regulated poly(A) polymerase [Caerostris darwini]|uniref:Speckle targeted PIP5K1A-regulated poly(A) polymerase n=1 Tax=Caerostris darwini TaxID=1538125 RepID=A0AAV4RFY2_9ARAC|nr:speckle targeted PIP5K1A-regulated poly(A) polymerase [Caerostris darwini]